MAMTWLLLTTAADRSEPPGHRVRWLGDSRLGDSQRNLQHEDGVEYDQDQRRLEHQNVTPRRDGESHGPPKLRRKSLAQDWGQEGVRRLGQIGNQLGIGGRCKVHMKVKLCCKLWPASCCSLMVYLCCSPNLLNG